MKLLLIILLITSSLTIMVRGDTIVTATLQGTCSSATMATLGNTGTTNVGGTCTPSCTLNLNTTKLACQISYDSGSTEVINDLSIKWEAVPPNAAGSYTFNPVVYSGSDNGAAVGSLNIQDFNGAGLMPAWGRPVIPKSWVQFGSNQNPNGAFAGLFAFQVGEGNSGDVIEPLFTPLFLLIMLVYVVL